MTQLTKGFFTDHSIASLTGGVTANVLLDADPQRQALVVSNPASTHNVAIGFVAMTGTGQAGTITLVPNSAPFILQDAVCTQKIFVIGTATFGVTCWTYP
jgi:hypothetical protein